MLNHYRINYTVLESIKSVFELHTETMNIWTHVLELVATLYFWYC